MNDFNQKLSQFLHDPVDKCFDISGHEKRAKDYAEGISELRDTEYPDQISSCMERSFLPKAEKYGLKKERLYQHFNEVRHPLSDGKMELPEYNKDEVFKKVKSVFDRLKKENLDYDDKKRFFFLWRNLVEKLTEEFKDSPLRKFIPVLPADTRIPDHSIWEHLKITSAINAWKGYQNNSLFLFTIGPVQDFISQARKMHDLFMGSFILSYLTFIAMEKVIERYGPTSIIYPDLFKQPLMDWFLDKKVEVKNSTKNLVDLPTIPNRFVAIIPLVEEKELNEIKKEVECKWKEIIDKIFLNRFGENVIQNKDIQKQFSDFPRIYWTVIPWRKGESDISFDELRYFFEGKSIDEWKEKREFAKDKGEHEPNIGFLYPLLYLSLEKSMGARKSLRDFNQRKEEFKQGEDKCLICGERKAIVGEEKTKRNVIFNKEKRGRYIRKNEALCTICFTKRALDKYLKDEFRNIFRDDFSFPSTSEIACAYFKERMYENEQFKDYVSSFKKLTRDKYFPFTIPLPKLKIEKENNLEGMWFYMENLIPETFERELGVSINTSELDELKNELKNLKNKLNKLYKEMKPTSYYAVLMLDGDDMGMWLAGEKLPEIEYAYNSETWSNLPDEFKKELKRHFPRKPLTPAIHSSISTALRNYSLEFVRKIVEEEHLGKLIYAGGDDVLAFVNLKDLFDVMIKLRASFSGHIKLKDNRIEVDWSNTTGFVEKDGTYLLTMGKNASISMGVVIAHYKAPLRIVLKKVREMEKRAKKVEGKNAFSIALMRRSGESKEGCAKWRYPERNVDTISILRNFSNLLKEGKDRVWFSDGFIYTLKKEFEKLVDGEGRIRIEDDLFKVELKRTLKRAAHGPKDEKEEKTETLFTELSSLFEEMKGYVIDFLHLLEICAFIAKEVEA